jgi:glutamate-1-semialdehyde aminotransferase
MARGIPPQHKQLVHKFVWNNLDSLKMLLTTFPIGVVICEVPPEDSQEQHAFLKDAIELAHKYGAVFILDEVVTGFRYSMSGAMGLLGVTPDMACFSKGMGNGYPIAAICGRKDIMSVIGDGVFFSSTFAGELVGVTAAIAVIDFLKEHPVISHIWEMGERLRNGMQSIIDSTGLPMKLWGNAPRTIIKCYDKDGKESNELKSLFLQEMCKRGVFMGVPTFISYAHTASHIDRTVDAFNDCSSVLVRAVDEGTDKFMEGDYISMKGMNRYWR